MIPTRGQKAMNYSGIIKQLVTERDRLNAAIAALQGINGVVQRRGRARKGTMSAAGRARVAAAQRKRWAKLKRKRG